MTPKIAKKNTAGFLLILLLLFGFTIIGAAQETGTLKGFIYKKNGKTPLWGVQVLLKNKQTGKIFESNVTDAIGDYILRDVPRGDYQVLLLSKDKSYKVKKVDFMVKVMGGKTSNLSFSLKKSKKFLFFVWPCDILAILAGVVAIIL